MALALPPSQKITEGEQNPIFGIHYLTAPEFSSAGGVYRKV